MDKFNENLEQFLTNLSKITNKDYAQHYDFKEPGDKYLQEFYNNCKNLGNDIANKDEIIFSEENTILEHVDFNEIWNTESLTGENKNIIWSYLYTLYIFAYEFINEVDLKNVLKQIKHLSADEEDLDEDTKTLINIINNLTNKFKDIEEEGDTESNTEGGTNFEMPEIFNGTIGNLAKEIAGELDMDKLNLEDPTALLQNLLSGNFDEENDESGIVNLVKGITGKIQDKISSGSINESDLFSEAQNVMKGFSNGGNPMEGMGDMGDLSNIFGKFMNNMSSMQKGVAQTNLNKKQQELATKDRLRKKLDEKKKLLAEQEQILEQELNNLKTEELKSIDDLVNEIEGITTEKMKKKKKKKKQKKQIEL